jgi:hypothetical protein
VAPQEMRRTRNTQSPGLRFRALLTEGADPNVQSGHLGLTSTVVASSFPKGRSLRASYAIYQSAWKRDSLEVAAKRAAKRRAPREDV